MKTRRKQAKKRGLFKRMRNDCAGDSEGFEDWMVGAAGAKS
jgi:hypothetical protein